MLDAHDEDFYQSYKGTLPNYLEGLDKKKRNEMRESFPRRFHPPASSAGTPSVRSSHSQMSRTLGGFRTTANQRADDLKSNTSKQWKPSDTQKIAAHSMFKGAFPKGTAPSRVAGAEDHK